jgi:chromosome segregation ATPase
MYWFASRNAQDIGWLDWLPLAQLAAEQTEQLTDAFNRLDNDAKNDLLERLTKPDAGPLAGAILVALSNHADQIENLEVRRFVLEHAVSSYACQADALNRIKTRLTAAQDRLREDFDLAVEIAGLEKELAKLRKEDLDQRLAALHRLYREVIKLEMRRQSLKSYEMHGLEQRIEALKRELAQLEQQREQWRNQQAKLQAQLEQEKREFEGQRKQLEDQLTQERKKLEEQLERERRKFEEQRKQLEEQLTQERKELEELRQSANRWGREELKQKIEEIYNLLPKDRADESLTTS